MLTQNEKVRAKMKNLKMVKEVKPSDISNFLHLKELTEYTQKRLGEMYSDPEDSSYYTPQQLKKITISKMIEENEIWGTLYEGNMLELECDSDTYRLAVIWYIDLDNKQATIYG